MEIARKQLASQREWAAFYTPLLETIGVVAVVVAGLVYCSFVIVYGLRCSEDSEVADLLLNDLVCDQPLLRPGLPASPVKLTLPSPGHAEQMPR